MARAHSSQITRIRLGCLLLIAAAALAVWANFPYISAEHRRWNFWQLSGLWFSDIAALLWFLRFALVHAIQGRPLVASPVHQSRKRFNWLALAIFSALLVDLIFSLFLMRAEKLDYARAQIGVAEIISVKAHKRELATEYEVDCHFRDSYGTRRQAHIRVYADKHQLPHGLAPETAQRIEQGQRGEISIRYVATHPERAWVDGQGWHDGNGIYWISIGNICVQGVTSLLSLLFMTKYSMTGIWPWWSDIYKVLPLTAETFCMLGMGLIDRIMDNLS